VLVLTMLGDDESLFAAVRSGARGYLLKTAAPGEVQRAIHAVAAGDMLLGADVARRAVSYLTEAKRTGGNPFPELTEREREVLDLVARGQDNPTIARTLVLTNKTVRNYVYGIATKLGATDRSALIVMAREAGVGVDSA
jgi:DNA-binding NarL/FixJ family response regulator